MRSLITREPLSSVEIRFFRPVSTDAVVLYHTFKLSDATIVAFRTSGGTGMEGGVTEAGSFSCGEIEVLDNANNFSAAWARFAAWPGKSPCDTLDGPWL